MKVELPSADVGWVVPIRVGERYAHLDNLEQVNVTSHRLIHVVVRRGEAADWTSDDAWKLGVLIVKQASRALRDQRPREATDKSPKVRDETEQQVPWRCRDSLR